jgi:hypothetical protein
METAASNCFHYPYPGAFVLMPFDPPNGSPFVHMQQLAASSLVEEQLSKPDPAQGGRSFVNCSTETGQSAAAITAKSVSNVSNTLLLRTWLTILQWITDFFQIVMVYYRQHKINRLLPLLLLKCIWRNEVTGDSCLKDDPRLLMITDGLPF